MDEDKPIVDAIIKRSRAILAVHDSGGMPENPFQVLRECTDMLERVTTALVETTVERQILERRR